MQMKKENETLNQIYAVIDNDSAEQFAHAGLNSADARNQIENGYRSLAMREYSRMIEKLVQTKPRTADHPYGLY